MFNTRILVPTILVVAVASLPVCAQAQSSRVGSDSATRLTRFGRDIAYGTVEGLGYAAIDQRSNSPPQWGTGWSGYGKRSASDIGEFLIQETVTEGLAAAMNRPLDYKRCTCHVFVNRVGHALEGVVADEMPNGSHRLAVPRITGAFVGSFAQATWRPSPDSRTRVALLNGASSFAFGAVIDLFHEFIH